MIEAIRQGLREEGIEVPVAKLCRWFDVPRRTVYYRPGKAAPKLQERFVVPIKQMIEEEPSFGYRTVANLLGFNKNTVQWVFQLKGWQVRKQHKDYVERFDRTVRYEWLPDTISNAIRGVGSLYPLGVVLPITNAPA